MTAVENDYSRSLLIIIALSYYKYWHYARMLLVINDVHHWCAV